MTPIEFVICAERGEGTAHFGMYMRDHDDGARSWCRDPAKAKRFKTSEEAGAYARKHTNMACYVGRV